MIATARHHRIRTRTHSPLGRRARLVLGSAATLVAAALATTAGAPQLASAAPGVGSTTRVGLTAGVPWGQVGPGWSVVSSSTTANRPDGHNPGPFTIALLSPTGSRYPVAQTTAQVGLTDVTRDGRRAVGVVSTLGSSTIIEWDLTTGRSHTVSTRADAYPQVRYTRPNGIQLLVGEQQGRAAVVTRMTTAGHVEHTYPAGSSPVVASTADGTRLMVTASAGGGVNVLDNATGRVLRSMPSPSGYHGCYPTGRWTGNDIVVRCTLDGYSQMDLLLLSATSGPWRALTHTDVTSPREPFGYGEAWLVGGRTLAAAPTGGGLPVGLLDSSGRIGTELSWPRGLRASNVAGVVGTKVYAGLGTGFVAPSTWGVQDTATGRTTTLMTAVALGGVVVPAS